MVFRRSVVDNGRGQAPGGKRPGRTSRRGPAKQPTRRGISIEEDGDRDTGVCPCCGHTSRVVWGYASIDGVVRAAYYVHWTLGMVREHGAHFDLILGDWHEGALETDRRAVSLACRILDTGPGLMVIDARDRTIAQNPLAGVPLDRSDVIGTDLAPLCFAVVDAIWLQDRRLNEITGAHLR